MLFTDAKVPNANPNTPKNTITMSFTIQKCLNKIEEFRWEVFQNVSMWIKGGNIIDNVLLAIDPTNVIRSPKLGILKASEAGEDKMCISIIYATMRSKLTCQKHNYGSKT